MKKEFTIKYVCYSIMALEELESFKKKKKTLKYICKKNSVVILRGY